MLLLTLLLGSLWTKGQNCIMMRRLSEFNSRTVESSPILGRTRTQTSCSPITINIYQIHICKPCTVRQLSIRMRTLTHMLARRVHLDILASRASTKCRQIHTTMREIWVHLSGWAQDTMRWACRVGWVEGSRGVWLRMGIMEFSANVYNGFFVLGIVYSRTCY